MSKKDFKKKVTDFVKSSKPRSTGHRLISQDEFLDGVVIAETDVTNTITKNNVNIVLFNAMFFILSPINYIYF